MRLKGTYLALCVAGTVLPYWFFLPWVARNGLNAALFVRQLFATPISGFFAMDVSCSAVVLIVLIAAESSRLRVRLAWLPLLATATVGVSLGLPLFLYLRQQTVDESRPLGTS